jgi:hypothetical protein
MSSRHGKNQLSNQGAVALTVHDVRNFQTDEKSREKKAMGSLGFLIEDGL